MFSKNQEKYNIVLAYTSPLITACEDISIKSDLRDRAIKQKIYYTMCEIWAYKALKWERVFLEWGEGYTLYRQQNNSEM